MGKSLNTAKAWAANASFNSTKSISSIVNPAFARALFIAETGAIPIIEGSTPATAKEIISPTGFSPNSLAFSSDETNIAAAPSLIPDALPAVTVPSAVNTGFSLLNAAIETSLGCSSISKTPFLSCTGTISFLKTPDLIAFFAFPWLSIANLSWSSLLMLYWSARFSAVIPIW